MAEFSEDDSLVAISSNTLVSVPPRLTILQNLDQVGNLAGWILYQDNV